MQSGLARLKDAESTSNSLYSRFDLAYSAAHALCLAALRHHGYRPSRALHRVPGAAGHARPGPEVWRVLLEVPRHAEPHRIREARWTSTNGSSST